LDRQEFGHHSSGLLLDDGAALGQFLFAMPHVLANDGFQVVDVIEINVRDELHVRVNVPRHGNINQNQRPVASRMHDDLDVLQVQNRLWTSGGADDDVRFSHCLNTVVKSDGTTAEFRRQRLRAIE